ncbi:MAG: hypothetical protein AB9856_02245 [Cellulosilyticaceae bacterium]
MKVTKKLLVLPLALLIACVAPISANAGVCPHSPYADYYSTTSQYTHPYQYRTCTVRVTENHKKIVCRICGSVLSDNITNTSEYHSKLH